MSGQSQVPFVIPNSITPITPVNPISSSSSPPNVPVVPVIPTELSNFIDNALKLHKIDLLSTVEKAMSEADFIVVLKAKLNQQLSILKPDSIMYNEKILMFVLSVVEHVFNESGKGKIKESIVIEVLKPYFKDDEALIKKFIALYLPCIEKNISYIKPAEKKICDRLSSFFLNQQK